MREIIFYRGFLFKLFILAIVIRMHLQCKQAYNPPAISTASSYLVVDGFISAGGDSTLITLSRTKNLSDTSLIFPAETGANVSVVGQNGETYPLTELPGGKYFSVPLTLNQNETYSVAIKTTNGESYQSDFVPVKICPAIDSINWIRSTDGVTIYANAHDNTNNTRYYRWQYVETWQYNAAFNSGLEFSQVPNRHVYPRPADEQVYTCWRSDSSTTLLLTSTEKLSNDVVYEFPLLAIQDNAQQLAVGYSILIKQYALSSDAFAYWQALKLNTEQLGTIFGPQPSQPQGNIHCITHANEPVIGFISAGTVRQQRVFIDNTQLPGWVYTSPIECELDSTDPRKDLKDLIGNIPVSYETNMAGVLFCSQYCGDCTIQGGSTVKPSFWPN